MKKPFMMQVKASRIPKSRIPNNYKSIYEKTSNNACKCVANTQAGLVGPFTTPDEGESRAESAMVKGSSKSES